MAMGELRRLMGAITTASPESFDVFWGDLLVRAGKGGGDVVRGQEHTFAAKPASKTVRARPAKAVRDEVGRTQRSLRRVGLSSLGCLPALAS
jgi:hypothetical protein